MQQRSKVAHDLANSLICPDRTKAFLDFTSGLIRVNTTIEKFSEAYKKPERSEFNYQLIESFFHEVQHYIQVSFFGYLYRYVVTLEHIVRSSLPKDFDAYSKIPTSVNSQMLFYSAQKDIERTIENKISVLSIVESLTYYIQTISKSSTTFKDYIHHLNTAFILPEYKDAYLYFAEFVGYDDGLLHLYCVVSQMSLLSHDPPETFIKLCEYVKSGKITLRTNLPQIIESCKKVSSQYLGFGWEAKGGFGSVLPEHLVYQDSWAWAQNNKSDFSKYLMQPSFQLSNSFLRQSSILVMANPYEDDEAKDFRKWPTLMFGSVPKKEQEALLSRTMLMAGAARKMFTGTSFGEDQWLIKSKIFNENFNQLKAKFAGFNYILGALFSVEAEPDLAIRDEAVSPDMFDKMQILLLNYNEEKSHFGIPVDAEKSLILKIKKDSKGCIYGIWALVRGNSEILSYEAYVLIMSKSKPELDANIIRFFEQSIELPTFYKDLAASESPIVGAIFLNEKSLHNSFIHATNHVLSVAVLEYWGLDLSRKASNVYNYYLPPS